MILRDRAPVEPEPGSQDQEVNEDDTPALDGEEAVAAVLAHADRQSETSE